VKCHQVGEWLKYMTYKKEPKRTGFVLAEAKKKKKKGKKEGSQSLSPLKDAER